MSNQNWFQMGEFHRANILVNKQGIRAEKSIENEYFSLQNNRLAHPRIDTVTFLGAIRAQADDIELFAKRMNEKHTNVSSEYDEDTDTHSFYSTEKNSNYQEELKVYEASNALREEALQKFSEYKEVHNGGPAIEFA